MQIASYDAAADDDEPPILGTPCVKALIDLAGVTLGQRRKIVVARREKQKPKDHTSTMRATTTPLVHDIFDRIFGAILDDSAAPKVYPMVALVSSSPFFSYAAMFSASFVTPLPRVPVAPGDVTSATFVAPRIAANAYIVAI